MTDTLPPISTGELAPEFTLPAVDGRGPISLADYRERTPVFLALMVGLWCPFCRRALAQMSTAEPKLKTAGIESLGVVATPPENAQLYFKFRPTRVRLAADPALITHRAYRVPKPTPTPEFMQAIEKIKINPQGDFPEPLPILEATAYMKKLDGYQENETDKADVERQWPQLKAQFLIDRAGIVRWAHIECAQEGPAGLGKFPTAEEILAVARALPN